MPAGSTRSALPYRFIVIIIINNNILILKIKIIHIIIIIIKLWSNLGVGDAGRQHEVRLARAPHRHPERVVARDLVKHWSKLVK
jgi:hypothetical protein